MPNSRNNNVMFKEIKIVVKTKRKLSARVRFDNY